MEDYQHKLINSDTPKQPADNVKKSKCYELLKEDLKDISISMAKNPKLVQMFIRKNLSKSLPDIDILMAKSMNLYKRS